MFSFDPALAPVLVYFVTAGVKSVFGFVSGYGSMAVAAGVGSLLLFGESLIGGLDPAAADVATAAVQLFLVVVGGFGVHRVIKSKLG